MPYSQEVWTFNNQVNHGGREIFYGFMHLPLTDSLTARAGGGQGSATALGNGVSIVTTVATTGDSVLLTTPAAPGLMLRVYNFGANSLNIFPASGHNILEADGNDLGANAAIALAANASMLLISRSATTWLVFA